MTKLTSDSPVVRETAITYRNRLLIVELHPGYLTLRRKGLRQSVMVDYAAVHDLGQKLSAREKLKIGSAGGGK